MKLLGAIVVLAVLVSACGRAQVSTPSRRAESPSPSTSAAPTTPAATGSERTSPSPSAETGEGGPPALIINGQAGTLVSFCWRLGCADGVPPDPSSIPAIAPPFEVDLPEGAVIEAVSAIGPGASGGLEPIAMPFEGAEIGDVVEGAVMLNVFVRFAQGGDASYYWALNRQ